MKTVIALLASFAAIASGYSQNIFPPSGTVGLGTTAPMVSLEANITDNGVGTQTIVGKFGRVSVPSATAREAGIVFSDANNPTLVGGVTGIRLNSNGNYYGGLGFYVHGVGPTPAGTFADLTRAMTIDESGNVGIGTTTPLSSLQTKGPLTIGSQNNVGWPGMTQIIQAPASPVSSRLTFGTDGTGWQFRIGKNQVGAVTDFFTVQDNGNVGIGTTSPSEKLSVNGLIRAKEVIVESSGWSDYVFADDYKLQSLADVEAQIKTNKHLPGVPSAQEVSEKGVSIGDMQAVLLAKIEELTLHVISQQKELGALRAKVANLESNAKESR
jgi:hypothetical protein